MVAFDDKEYKSKKDPFLREYRRIEPYRATTSDGDPREPRRPLTKDLNLREEYKNQLVEKFNDLIVYLHSVFDDPITLPAVEKVIKAKAEENLRKLKESFEVLNLKYEFESDIFSLIDLDKIIEDSIDDTADSHSDSDKSSSVENNKETTNTSQNTISSVTPIVKETKMPQSKHDFISMANDTINYKYSGDTAGLNAFIDGIELLDELCEADNKSLLLKFIMTRLDGKAREVIKDPKTAADVVTQLKSAIKNESSKVIEGRMLALRADKTNLTKFAERAEKLAEQYRRSLCDEGFSKDKAKELSIEKTVELCRKSSRSATLTSIIASTKFTEPKEVIAKMIVEISNLKQEGQSQQYGQKNGNKNKNKHFSNNGSSRSNGQNYNNNQNHGASSSGYQNNNGKKYNNSGSNNRNGQNNNSNGQNRTYTNSNFRRSNNDQSIRMISGNQSTSGNGGDHAEN